MFRLINILPLLFLLTLYGNCQENFDFPAVDGKTYQFYLNKEWDKLIVTGKESIKKGLDYYYLRIRIGIAYYETKNYMIASRHFIKALKFSNHDPLALEYLYYSYLFSGKNNHAWFITKFFTPSLREKTSTSKQPPVKNISADYFYNYSFIDDIVADPDNFFPADIPGYQMVTRNFSNFSMSAIHSAGPRVSIFHGYTFLNKTNFYFLNTGLNIIYIPDQIIKQHQYYVSPSIVLTNGWQSTPSFHYLYITYPYVQSIESGGSGGLRINTIAKTMNNFVAGLSVNKMLGRFNASISSHYSNLNEKHQLQPGIRLIFYPLGNLNLYTGTEISMNTEFADNSVEYRPVASFLAGFSIFQKAWFELSGSLGNISNYTERNGYIVYNGLDVILNKYGLNMIIPITRKGTSLYAGGRYSTNRSRLYSFFSPEEKTLNEITYNSLSFYGGLSWKF